MSVTPSDMEQTVDAAPSVPPALVLSAPSADALAGRAHAIAAFLQERVVGAGDAEPELSGSARPTLADVCYTAAHHCVHQAHRMVAVGGGAAEMAQALRNAADGRHADGPSAIESGQTSEQGRRKVAFLFSGQGGQWLGMGRRLRASSAEFARAVARCDEAIRAYAGWSVCEVLDASSEDGSLLGQIEYIQPSIFTMQVALASALRACGVVPDIVVGHSLGEVAAAHVAGALSIEDAVRVICAQGRALTRITGRGSMLMVEMDIAAASDLVSDYPGRLDVAVHGSARSTVLAGDVEALDEVAARLGERGVFAQRVKVDVAGHSPHIDELRAQLLAEYAALRPRRLDIPMLSTVTLQRCQGPEFTGEYWYRNLRERVHLYGAVVDLLRDGCEVLIEVSPNPVVQPAVSEVIRERAATASLLTCMRAGQDETSTFASALAGVFITGAARDSARLLAGLQPPHGHRVALPEGAAQGRVREPAWQGKSFIEHMYDNPPERRRAVVEQFLLRELAVSLGVSEREIDPRVALVELGVDSVRGADLRGRLESELRIALSPSYLWRYPTASALSAHIYQSLEQPEPSEQAAPVEQVADASAQRAAAADATADDLDAMDDDELARLLADELASLQD